MLGFEIRRAVLIGTSIGFLVSAQLSAQNGSVPDLTGLSLEDLSRIRLSTASRHLDDPRKAPTAITVIDSDEIQRYGWRTLADVLRSVTGFYTANDRSYTYIGVRGFLQSGDYNARILIQVDGHRINDNIYDSGLAGTELPLDLSLIDRIEIVRGPGSSLFGTDAELAVVNILTRHPANQNQVEVTGEADSFLGRAVEVRASVRAAGTAALLSGSMYRSNGASSLYFPEFDSPNTNNGIATDMDGDRYSHLFGVVEHGRFKLEGLFGVRDKIVPNAPYATAFGDPRNRTMDTRGYLDASYSFDVGSNTQVDLRAYYDAYRYFGSFPYQNTTGSGNTVQINDAAADGLGLEAVLARRLGRHRVVAGASGEYNLRINQRNYYVGEAPFLDDNRQLRLAAIFGEAELNPSQKLSFNVGGRVDWYNLYGRSLSPRIAAMYFPTPDTSVKYVFSHAFRAPDPYDEFYVDQVDVTAPSRNLKPENIDSQTLLFDHAFNKSLQFRASGFYNRLRQSIEEQQDPDGATHFANRAGDSGRGIEAEVVLRLQPQWSVRASYTASRTREIDTAKPLDNSPRTLAKVNSTAPLKRLGSLGTELLYAGPQYSYQGTRVGSSFLVNTTLTTRTFWKDFQLNASCYNLLDRRWATPTGPEVVSPATVQDGRTWRFRLTYRPADARKWRVP